VEQANTDPVVRHPYAMEFRCAIDLSMISENTNPRYSVEVTPCTTPAGHFQWAIRERGKLIQRSDRSQATEEKAWEKAQAELERMQFGGWDRR